MYFRELVNTNFVGSQPVNSARNITLVIQSCRRVQIRLSEFFRFVKYYCVFINWVYV